MGEAPAATCHSNLHLLRGCAQRVLCDILTRAINERPYNLTGAEIVPSHTAWGLESLLSSQITA